MKQGAAVGIGSAEQCPQHQEAERERQVVGRGVYGGRRGGVRGLGLAAPLGLGAFSCRPRRSALVWTALRGRAFLSGPHSPHRLLCSRSRGAARRVQGAAGGGESWLGEGERASARAANLVFGESDMTNFSEIQIGESAFCRNI